MNSIRHIRKIAGGVAFGLLVLFALGQFEARGQDQDLSVCQTAADADARVQACTRLLEAEVQASAQRQAITLTLRAIARKAKGEVEQAAVDHTAAIALAPDFAPAYVARGDLLRDNDQCDLALADYDQAIKLQPDRAAVYFSRALCLFDRQQVDRAGADLDKVVALDADNSGGYAVPAWRLLARFHASKGDVERALSDFDAAIKLDPRRADLYVDRGNVWASKGDDIKSIADYDAAIKLDEDNSAGGAVAAWMGKARLHLQKKDLDAAIMDLDAAIKLSPKDATLYVDRAGVFTTKGEEERALADYGEAIIADPASGFAYNTRGDFFRGKGDYARAAADYDKAIEAQPADLTGYGNRALVRFYQGEFGKAADDFRRVADAQANAYPTLLLYLSLTRAGNANGAKVELTKAAAKLKPGAWPYPVVELYLGRKAAQAIEAAAAKPEEKCEAQFYIGQWHLVRGARPLAAKALQAAVDTCPKDFVEYRGALAELKRLTP